MRRLLSGRAVALFVALLALFGLTGVGQAAAVDNAVYYLGSTWNPWTVSYPVSYSPYGEYSGRVTHGVSYQVFTSGGTQFAVPLKQNSPSGYGGWAGALYWAPCVGANGAPPCDTPDSRIELKRVIYMSDNGVIAYAQPDVNATKPFISNETANPDYGVGGSWVTHTAGIVLDQVKSSDYYPGYTPQITPMYVTSVTGGFGTSTPLSLNPRWCFNYQFDPYYAGGQVYAYEVCHSMVPHT